MYCTDSLDLSAKRIAIVTHVLRSGNADDLLRYLLERGVAEVLFIRHPLEWMAGKPGPNLRQYLHGELAREVTVRNRRFTDVVRYVRDAILTLYWIVQTRRRWDLIVGFDNLNCASAIAIRRMGLTKRVVYYTIDFTPQRFPARLMNDVYHLLDKFCVRHADVTWNVSDRIAEGREAVRGLRREEYPRQVTVPIGNWFQDMPRKPFDEIEAHSLVYSGGFLDHQGLDLVVDAAPAIAAKVPGFRLYITGAGPLDAWLWERVAALKLEKHVSILGYIDSRQELNELLSRCAAGVAMYDANRDRWSRYADPSKIKLYLAAGLAVLTTDVTHIASEIRDRNAGMVLPFDREVFAGAVTDLLQDPERLCRYRANALALGRKFDWPGILDHALVDRRIGLSDR